MVKVHPKGEAQDALSNPLRARQIHKSALVLAFYLVRLNDLIQHTRFDQYVWIEKQCNSATLKRL
jgi:hypothetical protein